ncbi:E3 ubiquitin-protein ligase rnf213-alpha-like [Babylonia areolata]|uniref:E3 ubiquitin-protein ligase rnf213-alpha-like n=1 Tax=Babylonia areolata TaxID=304850 RepID=UPI003FD1D5F5
MYSSGRKRIRRLSQSSSSDSDSGPSQKQKVMKCQGENCGRLLSSDVKFCPNCGTPNKAKEETITCSSCDEAIPANARFCCHCGAKVTRKQSRKQPRKCTGTTEDGEPCGFVLADTDTFCLNCGTKVDNGADKTASVSGKDSDIVHKDIVPAGKTASASGRHIDIAPKEVDSAGKTASASGGNIDNVHKDIDPDANKPAPSGSQGHIPFEQDEGGQDDPHPSDDKNELHPFDDNSEPHPSDNNKGTDLGNRACDGGRGGSGKALPSAEGQAAWLSDKSSAENRQTPRECDAAGDADCSPESAHIGQAVPHMRAPVVCSDDSSRGEEAGSPGVQALQGSAPGHPEEGGNEDDDETDPAQSGTMGEGTSDDPPNGETAPGSKKTFFAEFADKSFIDVDPASSNMCEEKQVQRMTVNETSRGNTSSSSHRQDKGSEDPQPGSKYGGTSSAAGTKARRDEDAAEPMDVDKSSKIKTSSEDDHPEKESETKDSAGIKGKRIDGKTHDKNKSGPKEMDKPDQVKTHDKKKSGPEETDKPDQQKAGKDRKNDAVRKEDGARGSAGDRDGETSASTSYQGRGNDRWRKAHSAQESAAMSYACAAGKGVTTRAMAQNNGPKRSLTNNADMVTVVFHVIVSDMWEEMNPHKYNLFIRCRPHALGTWNPSEDKNKMTFIGETGIGYLYKGALVMQRHLRNSGFQYKYIAKKDGMESRVHWELVQRKEVGVEPAQVNRHFSVPENRRTQTGQWNRYDGVAYFPGSFNLSVWQRFKGWIGLKDIGEGIRHNAFSSAQVFLPAVDEIVRSSCSPASNGQTTMEGYLDKVVQVMSSLSHQMRDVGQHYVDDSLVCQAVMEVLALPLAKHLAETGTVTLGLFTLLLVEEFSLPVDNRVIQVLCRSMLISPAMNNTTCADLDSIASHFPASMANRANLATKISRLINNSDQKGWQFKADASWLFCVPLLHFLQGRSQPFQDPEPSSDFKTDGWWGLTGVERRKKSYMENTSTSRLSPALLEQLAPAFQVDPLFVRTLVASLELDPLLPVLESPHVPVPLEVMAATLAHHVEHKNYLYTETKTKLETCLEKMISLAKEKAQMKADRDMKDVKCTAHTVLVLHYHLIRKKHLVTEDILRNGTYLAFLALDQMALAEERVSQLTGGVQAQSWRPGAQRVTETSCDWLSSDFHYSSRRSHALRMWDKLITKVEEDLNHGELKQTVKKLLADGFETKMRLLSAEQKLEVYLEQYNVAPAFADILNRLAFESLDAAFQMESKYLARDQDSSRLISLLSTFIERKWTEQVTGEDKVLKFVITWIPMVNYFTRFGKKKSSEQLSERAAQHIRHALLCVQSMLDVLGDGSVLIKDLQLMQSNRERFLAVAAAADHRAEEVTALLELRDHEMNAFVETTTRLDRLLEHCQNVFVTADLPAVLKKIEEVQDQASNLPLSEVCSVALPDNVKDLRAYNPKTNPWKLPENILSILPVFEKRISSYIFRKMFFEFVRKTDLSSVDFWRAFHVVWSDVNTEWQTLCQKMTEGTITLADTQRVFSMFRRDNGSYRYDELRQELHKLSTHNDPGRWVDERIEQFTCFTAIKDYVSAASVLLNVRAALNVDGDFENIRNICRLSHDKNLPMNKVDRSVLRLCKQLEHVTPQDVRCLEEFLNPRCVEFVAWLKEKMKDGVKELTVFVDLAYISAGELPWAIGRVSCFHAATIGYAPLIFMEKGEGCRHLLQQCELVFKNVKADPSLPKNLTDSSRYLDWFKSVEKSLGSVEKTCLSQVGSINERGVFRIGRGNKQRMTLPSVIQLKVSEEVDPATLNNEDRQLATPPRKYTYEELLDLQSRLMLVAGEAEKGKENVDRFITIMESLMRLGKTYVQLCRDGCVLFLDWTVEFLCDVKRPVCCVSEFSSQGKLKGHRKTPEKGPGGKEDLEDFIAGVAAFLEQCHTEWLDYVDRKRRDYPELNVFTVEQLVFLQQQLIKAGSEEVSRHVYPMLSLLKEDCSPQDLEQALQDAMDRIDALRHPQQPSRPQAAAPQPAPVTDKEKVALFMSEITDNGFSKGLALKALRELGAENIAEGIAWCMKHEDDDLSDDMEEEEDMEEEGEEEEGVAMEEEGGGRMVRNRLREWVTRKETITQCAIGWLNNMDKRERGTTLLSLTGNLDNVWRRFLETVSSSGMDFLSLEHLGIVLQCLAAKDERQFKRVLPPNFKPRIPNLILCPKNEVLNAVTYMYMFPEEDGSPLPQPDEVLLCTEHTTFEQVDIFLRRAFFGRQQKVYCLAFADNLDYDVGEKTEKKINEYTSMAGDHDCQLVVVCTTENEFRARIVAALEKFRQPSPALSTPDKVRTYLRPRFAGVVTKADVTSASAVDPDSLSVRVVKSSRSGVGKTLYKQRVTSRLRRCLPGEQRPVSITIPLHGRLADTADIAACLLQHTLDPSDVLPRVVHLDISYQVLEGVDHLLYSLLVLGCVTDSQGQVWLRSPMDLYLVETMPLFDHKEGQGGQVLVHQIFDVLPSLNCWSPQDSLSIMKNRASVPGYKANDCLFDQEEFSSHMYQLPYRYLQELDPHRQPTPAGPQGDATAQMVDCLGLLLRYCGVVNPSWSEMTHFVRFLHKQLQDFENSLYCGDTTSQDLPGFSRFVLRFLVQMSRDFATRSLIVSEESLAALVPDEIENTDIDQYVMRRTWESSPHPYIFFNPDGVTMTFLGFSIDANTGNLVDHQTGRTLEQGIMTQQLFDILCKGYKVPLAEDFDALPREDRLLRLYRALGLRDEEMFDENNEIIDPDDTYELTTDNVKKILAIYMRFRCNIPVIVMGETGCGKTRLVKFLCALQTPKHPHINTRVQVKVHGGTTGEDIINKVRQAERLARQNATPFSHRPVYTVLFFDEANTTEAVGVIKEVMCDGTLDGQHMNLCPNLKMVAACNPYRKHSDELIERLENAGLGYHVDADKTVDKLGRVPMRRLVYRVQPLPQSMLPLVWDFGQLSTRVENLYIRQMVRRYVREGQLAELDDAGMNVLCKILMESQEFMRKLADECSFVSLRDVDRALTVASWFLEQARHSDILFRKLDRKLDPQDEEEEEEEAVSGSGTSVEDEEEEEEGKDMKDMTKALVLSLGVCYRACLRSKEEYDRHIIPHFQHPFTLPDNLHYFARVIDRCQDVFLDSVRLEDNIARNQALKDNVFMMVVCIELRIPLFLVGKPGSSKSLAKTIVADAMQGNAAYSELFKTFKQAQMVSFQCSPLATADGILGTFRQCAKFQEGKSKTSFVSVVVLDEVGLAEDSPRMPLKTLHPLLEDGCPGDEVPDDSKKVAFIGISNWALDPAKMNRGILVQRDVPDEDELIETARGICTTQDELALHNVNELIPDLAKAYLNIFKEAKLKREFFGLRDFYSLVKMVYSFAAESKCRPSQRQLIAAIRRNFGGLDTIDPVESFRKLLPSSLCAEKPRPGDPDCTPSGLIKAALSGDDMGGETRYLLLLTENYGGLSILSENLLADRRVVPIFGSSFPKDQEYTQICRNINRIKVCMETGQTVILLNLENLYESLYDALNQYYATLGSDRFVDLGLGTHRVKCKVHRQFRLIVVAEKQAVYDKFPIPLINRLEKHFLTLNNIMTPDQLDLASRLEAWAREFVTARPQGQHARFLHMRREKKKEEVGDVFMGYHPDTAPAIVLKVWEILDVAANPSAKQKVLEESQRMLLWCATPDAVVRSHDTHWSQVYHDQQQHEQLLQYLEQRLQQHLDDGTMLMAQVTTHSKLLTEQERATLQKTLPVCTVTLLSLQAFDTEQQFCQQLRLFFSDSQDGHKLLLVQCDSGDSNQNLIKGAQYCMQDLRPVGSSQHHVVFIIQLPSIAGACFTGFLGGNWHCVHIDDMRATDRPVPSSTLLQTLTVGQLIMAAIPMVTDPQTVDAADDLMQWEEGGEASAEAEGGQAAPMEVDVMDVQLEEMESGPSQDGDAQAMATEVTQPQGFSRQYVRDLFRSGIQAAVALVRDPEEGTLRATRRITILLDLLEENADFFKGLHKLVASVLKERELRMVDAERWLSRDAAKLETVKKAGTFRRSWMQYIENKVVPVLAGVIAYLDTNHNLDLHPPLTTTPHGAPPHTPSPSSPPMPPTAVTPGGGAAGWVGELWVAVLQEVCELQYQRLRSTSDKEELDEFTVHHTGAASLPVSARLPFSWLLWEFVDRAITGAKSVEGDLLDSAGGVVDQSPLGQCIRRVLGGEGEEEKLGHMFQLYIADLLHFTFPLAPQLHQLLCVCVEKGLAQLHISLVHLEVGRGLVALHMLVEQMRPRLQAVMDMATTRPDAVTTLQAEGAGGACRELLGTADEMTEDVALLRLMVEELQPRPGQLDDEEGCGEWVARFTAAAPVIMRILSDSDSALALAQSPPAAIAPEERGEGEEGAEEEEEEVSAVSSLPYGDKCKRQLVVIRCLWTRVATLKLFLDFVGPLRSGPPKLSKALESVKLRLLCNLLGDNVDMKRAESLGQVDDFLKRANSRMIGSLLGKLGKCTYCDTKFQSSPVELPCSHRLCNSCYRDSCHGNRADAKCPECDTPVPPNFDPATAHNRDREAGELLGRYQRQISGFLMALVSQLCFAGRSPPEPAAVSHIFGYIIHKSKGRTLLQTKNMTVHDDLIDPTPVLRSFLLRLLLKHSEKDVYVHLEKFLTDAQTVVDQEMAASPNTAACPTLLEFCLLIIHCVEDLHHEQDAVISVDLHPEGRLLFLADTLQELSGDLRSPPSLLPSLYTLGRLRHVLDACTHVLHGAIVVAAGTGAPPVIGPDLDNLLRELKDLCVNGDTDWPKKFLVKQLCREYGIQDFMTLVKRARQDDRLDWLTIQESDDQVEAVADRYLLCGDQYKAVRDLLAQVKLDGDLAELLQALQNLQLGGVQKETLLLLALHREITMSVLYPTPDPVRAVVADNVRQLIQNCDALQDKALAQQLCDNQLGEAGSLLQVCVDQDLGTQSLLCVLTHLRLALRPRASPAPSLLSPLSALLFQPATMVNAFLPTMPQDNIQEVLAVIQERVWQCPRGHRYLIGNCGQPMEESVCPCGLKIGGANHTATANNVQNTGADTTQKGHVLGPAAQRGLEAVPERRLTSVECSILRFLLHAVLYLSSSSATQAAVVCQVVTPRIAPDQCAQFFVDHMEHDLKVLQRCLGRSADDVFLVLHHVCHLLASCTLPEGPQHHLATKEERGQWEQQFTPVFIAPAVQNMDAVVQDGNQAIVSDTRQGNTALLKVVYEDEDAPLAEGQDVQRLPLVPSVWRFRPPITVDHFFRHFHLEVESRQDAQDAFPVLRLFKRQRHIVEALHYVPAILRGQRRLMMQLHRRLDRAEAATLTVEEVLNKKEHTGLEQLLSNFSKAWEIVKEHLIGYQCVAPIEGVMVSLPEEFHNATISEESPLAVLLPSMQGTGLCSYVFLQFILGQHNDFLDSYSAILRQKLPEVPVRAVTERHLVGCSVEHDLLPMVLSHSNYSLMVGRAARLEYDFEAFQQQLQDTLLQCKAKVERSPVGQFPVETMVYRADTTSSRLFKAVREKIPQECLSPAERRQIVEDLRDLPDICQSIDNLNTALSFLKALGGAPATYLDDFMTKALKMTRTIFSRKAQQLCQLTHVQSLWLVLCHQRAIILAAHHQDAFDSVERELREDMSVEQGMEVERMCQQMSVERLELLLLQLFECIMLHLTEPHTQDDDVRPENFKLRDVLMTNLDTPLYHTEPVEVRSGLLSVNDLLTFPDSLQGRHATATWMLCRAQLAHKRQMLL